MSTPRAPAPWPSFGGGPRLLLLSMLVGLLAGSAALAFRWLATVLTMRAWNGGADLVEAVAAAPAAWRLAVPALGGLIAGLVLAVGASWTRRLGGWDILEAVVLRDGVLHAGPTAVKSLSSLATVASGGAVGREGPIVLLAATVASQFGRALSLSTRQLRILVGCGIATGLACAYNTPVGAALFTMEVIFGSFALEVFSPLVVASVVATLLTRGVFGNEPAFGTPAVALGGPLELLACVALGVAGGALAALFLQALRWAAASFRRVEVLPRPLGMAAVGLLLGVALLRYPELVGNGREAVAHLFAHQFTLGQALALLALRLALTPLTVGSGAVGGVFTPTLFLGAMLGNAFGVLAQPWVGAEPRAYALVGMACLLAGTTHAPLTSVLMVFEMTLDYDVVMPLLLGAAVSSLIATTLSRESVYTEALRRKSGESSLRLVRLLTVRDVLRQEQATVPPELPLAALLERFMSARRNHLYVLDPEGRFLGGVSLHDANRELVQGGRAVTAADLLRRDFEATVPEEPLDRVLDRFARQPTERLPVLDGWSTRRLVGTVSRRDILSVLSLDLLQRPAAVVDRADVYDEEAAEVDVPGDCVGRTVSECDLPARHAVALLTIRRDGRWLLPEPGTRLETGDRLLVTGRPEHLALLR